MSNVLGEEYDYKHWPSTHHVPNAVSLRMHHGYLNKRGLLRPDRMIIWVLQHCWGPVLAHFGAQKQAEWHRTDQPFWELKKKELMCHAVCPESQKSTLVHFTC